MTTDRVLELANRICYKVTRRRMRRAAMWDEYRNAIEVPLDGMSKEDQQPWLDVAEVVDELLMIGKPIEKLRSLTNDWVRYTAAASSSIPWADEKRQAVVIEMRAEVEKLWIECNGPQPHRANEPA